MGGWLFKPALQCTLTSRPELSCKARTGISSNSLGCADRGEGWKMLRLPLPLSCASPNVGENNECTERSERFIAEGERTGGNNASLCKPPSLCNAWPFAKGTLDKKLGRPLYLSMLPGITPKIHVRRADIHHVKPGNCYRSRFRPLINRALTI